MGRTKKTEYDPKVKRTIIKFMFEPYNGSIKSLMEQYKIPESTLRTWKKRHIKQLKGKGFEIQKQEVKESVELEYKKYIDSEIEEVKMKNQRHIDAEIKRLRIDCFVNMSYGFLIVSLIVLILLKVKGVL